MLFSGNFWASRLEERRFLGCEAIIKTPYQAMLAFADFNLTFGLLLNFFSSFKPHSLRVI
jgi:hypothetical protein